MALKVAARGGVPPFIVMDVMRAAEAREAAGKDVVHLEVGQPSTSAPAAVLKAAQAALAGDRIGYTTAFGIAPLRARLAEWYRARYGVAVDPARIAFTAGSSGAFVLTFLAAFDVGNRVALAAPGYPAYRNILTALGVETVSLESTEADNFQPTVALLERAGRLDGLIVASPSNPTGTMVSRERLASLAGWCRANGVRFVSDEIYHGITYGEPASTVLSVDPDAVVISSFSKYFSMTGWRLGWAILPSDLLRAVECLAQNLFISPPTLSQHAALAAFDCVPELEGHVARYAENRALLLEELPKAGLDRFARAEGAFYLYADVAHLTNDSVEFCRRMLDEAGVAATPGTDFDPARGNRFMRFSFAGSTAEMAEAARRLQRWRR